MYRQVFIAAVAACIGAPAISQVSFWGDLDLSTQLYHYGKNADKSHVDAFRFASSGLGNSHLGLTSTTPLNTDLTIGASVIASFKANNGELSGTPNLRSWTQENDVVEALSSFYLTASSKTYGTAYIGKIASALLDAQGDAKDVTGRGYSMNLTNITLDDSIDGKQNHSIKFQSLPMNGVVAEVSYSDGNEMHLLKGAKEVGYRSGAGRSISAAAMYSKDSIKASVAVNRQNSPKISSGFTSLEARNAWLLSGSYDMVVAKPFASLYGVLSTGIPVDSKDPAKSVIVKNIALATAGVNLPINRDANLTISAGYLIDIQSRTHEAANFTVSYVQQLSPELAIYSSASIVHNKCASEEKFISYPDSQGIKTPGEPGTTPLGIVFGANYKF